MLQTVHTPVQPQYLPPDKPSNAPEACPGTESDQAGKSSACEGCPNQDACQTAPKGPDPDLPLISDRMKSVKHKILVLSGKGGVGKSTVTTSLAWALADEEATQVGIMDIDVCGPSIPVMLGMSDQKVQATSVGWSPIYVTDNLCAMSIGFLLPSSSDAVIWRGPKKNGLIKQFLKDVDWGELDFMLVDTPPGTSDEHLSISNYLKDSGIDGAIVVTTPQEVSLQDVRKEIDFCHKAGIKILGIVENMSGFVCPGCKNTNDIFVASTGGADGMAKQLGLDVLGKVPLDPRIGMSCDSGKSFMENFPESPATLAYLDIVDNIQSKLEQVTQT